MKLWVFILVVLILADKLITYKIIEGVQQRYPQTDAYNLEVNHLYRFFFRKYGLLVGTIYSFLITLGITILALWLLQQIGFWIFLTIYAYVLANNLFKYFQLLGG